MSVTLDKCPILEGSLYIQEMFGLYRPGMCFNLPNSRPYLFVCLNELGRNPFVLYKKVRTMQLLTTSVKTSYVTLFICQY